MRKRDHAAVETSSGNGASDELRHEYKSFTELRARNNAGEEVSFEMFANNVVLVVNVARL